MGKHNRAATHGICRRCGEHSYFKQKGECAHCGFGKTKRIRKYAWHVKVHRFDGKREWNSRKVTAARVGQKH